MGFFKGLKRAFGFSNNGEERDDELDGVDGSAARQPYVNPFKSDTSVNENATPKDDSAPQAETHSQDEVASLRQRLDDSEAQRRALQARANSLSERVATLESNQEQLELENKSLVNKLKVAQVQNGDTGAAIHEVDELTAEFKSKMELTNVMLNEFRAEAARKTKELEALRQQLETDDPHEEMLKAKVEEIEELKKQHLADLKQKDEDIAALNVKIVELEKEVSELNEMLEDNDTESFEAEVEQELKKLEVFKAKKEQEIADYKEKVANRDQQIAELQTTLAASEQVQVKLNKQLGELKKESIELAGRHNRRDIETANRISDLTRKLKDAGTVFQQEIASLTKENHALKEALDLAKLELELKAEEETRAEEMPDATDDEHEKEEEIQVEPVAETVVEPAAEVEKIEEVSIPLGDDLDDLDWLVPSPPTPVVEEKPEPEPAPAPSAAKPSGEHQQLSLF